VVLAVFVGLLAATAEAQPGKPTIAVPENDILWGFDGTVMRDRFNPLTLVLDNPTPEPFDGPVRLYRSDFTGKRSGGFLVETVYLAPGTRRMVQFYPLSLGEMEAWVLEWDGGQVTLPQPRRGTPARVLIADDRDLFDRGGAVKRFPARYFPPYETATDGLGEVVFDSTPDWDAPRRQAFLDWLRAGGVVHLIKGSDGRHPEFTGDLVMLNEPSDEFRVGAGRVRRHDVARSGLTRDYVRRQMDPPEPPPDEVAAAAEAERANQYGVYNMPLEEHRMASNVFGQLKQMVKAEHNWGVIHLLSLSYVAVLFPGCFLIGREFRNVPVTFGAIAGSTLLFGGAFFLVGNRGYGESTSVHTVALAEHVDGDKFDVTQWSSVFVTSGGTYSFSNAGEERLYSDATDNEPVGGDETAGSQGRFVADVPPYSTRIYAEKALLKVPQAAAPKPVAQPGGAAYQLPAGFPASVREAYLLTGDRMSSCSHSGGLVRPMGAGTRVKEFLKPQSADYVADAGWGQDVPADTRLANMIRPLMLYSLRLTKDEELKDFRLPEGRGKLFVYAPLSEPFYTLSGKAPAAGAEDAAPPPAEPLPAQTGTVLYVFDVAL
jgi:hypothetical protein